MAEPKINLADPDFEPTDEQLAGLMKRAFADVPRRSAEALARVHAEIAEGRAKLRAGMLVDPQRRRITR